jgi:hypothetical protein
MYSIHKSHGHQLHAVRSMIPNFNAVLRAPDSVCLVFGTQLRSGLWAGALRGTARAEHAGRGVEY